MEPSPVEPALSEAKGDNTISHARHSAVTRTQPRIMPIYAGLPSQLTVSHDGNRNHTRTPANCGESRKTPILAPRLLVASSNPIPRRLQRKRPEEPGSFHNPKHGHAKGRPRPPGPRSRHAVLGPLHPLLHDRRFPRRPLQQTDRHHLDQVLRDGSNGPSHSRTKLAKPESGNGRSLPGKHASGIIRTVKVRTLTRITPRRKTFLGQRRPRTRNVLSRNSRRSLRRIPCRCFPIPSRMVRPDLPKPVDSGINPQPGNRKSPTS